MTFPDAVTVPFKPYHGRDKRSNKTREFVVWDSEGITPEGQSRQNLVLFGCSTDTPETWLQTTGRLSTHECLSHILDVELSNPDAIHVGFAFNYDVEMILGDIPIRTMRKLRKSGFCYWATYRIEYKPKKWFQISSSRPGNPLKISARIWDVWGFFQSSFLVAVKTNIPDLSDNEYAALKLGKESRRMFTVDELDDFVVPYWRSELALTVRMMNALREQLYSAGFPLNQWYGPGALANLAFKQNNVLVHMAKPADPGWNDKVNRAAQYAYVGGRFELFKLGHREGPVYAYDIRSAYPAGIAKLPSLKHGRWTVRQSPDPLALAPFGLYRIRFSSPALMSIKPMPFFYRDNIHNIHFPNVTEGWYWTPEAELVKYLGVNAEILYGYEFEDTGERPFTWVAETYDTRARWKREGNASQMALKLLLNSIYGKMAQRIGWEKKGEAPMFHQLEWAGWVTSHARAQLFRAMLLAYNKGGLIGVETDGIFTSEPITLDIGPGLGQWELTEYDAMTYLQSGFYFIRSNGEWVSKYRGFDKTSVSLPEVHRVLSDWTPWTGDAGNIVGSTTRFSTMGEYLQGQFGEHLRNVWQTSPRTLALGNDGKRVHRPSFCPECLDKASPMGTMHTLTIAKPIGGESNPHILPWKPFADGVNPHRANE